MSTELQKLRLSVARLKAAPIFNKAALAEQAMDAALVVIARQDDLIARHYDSHLKLLADVLKLSNELERIKKWQKVN